MSQIEIIGMVKKPPERFDTLYIGQWITKLGRKQGEVAKKSGVDEGYMSQLISGEKTNPGGPYLMAISEELGITVNQLYEEPPEIDVTDHIKKLTVEQIDGLKALLDAVKPAKGRK